MEFRQACDSDLPGIRNVWKCCFGDEDSYLDFYLKQAYRNHRTWLCLDHTLVVSMMTLLPVCMERQGFCYHGAYVYAVATLPEYQHRGLMSQLHEQVELFCQRNGLSFLALVPATLSLFSMYQKLGYEVCTWLYYDTVSKRIGKSFVSDTEFYDISVEDFLNERQIFLKQQGDFLRFEEDCWEYTAKELKAAGYSCLGMQNQFGKGYLVYYVNEKGQLRIREAGISKDGLKAGIGDICHYFGVSEFFIKLPWGGFSGKENCRPFAMMKSLDKTTIQPVYMNLMLDD